MFEQLYHCQHHCISTHNSCKISEGLYVIGKSLKDSLTELEINTLSNFSLDNYKTFSRIFLNGIKIHAYKKSYHNSAISYVDEHHKIGYGIVQKILLLNDATLILIIIKLRAHSDAFKAYGQNIPHIESCIPPCNSDLVVLRVNDIYGPCVYMSFSDITDKIYVSVLTNLLEKD